MSGDGCEVNDVEEEEADTNEDARLPADLKLPRVPPEVKDLNCLTRGFLCGLGLTLGSRVTPAASVSFTIPMLAVLILQIMFLAATSLACFSSFPLPSTAKLS